MIVTEYQCCICGRRICDSTKPLLVSKLSKRNESKADVIVKCIGCKSTLAIKVANACVSQGVNAPSMKG